MEPSGVAYLRALNHNPTGLTCTFHVCGTTFLCRLARATVYCLAFLETASCDQNSSALLPSDPLRIEPYAMDLGRLKQFQSVDADFRVCNVSREPVRVTRITTSCGCMAPNWTDRELKPGVTEVLKLQFTTGTTWGMKEHSAQLFLRDAKSTTGERTMNLLIRAEILPDIGVQPDRIDFGEVQSGNVATARVGINRVGLGEPLCVSNAITTSPALRVSIANDERATGGSKDDMGSMDAVGGGATARL